MTQHVYHWKHGWIPLDHTAALSKAKGNHERAAAMLADAHGHDAGINSKQHVAKAAIGVAHLPAADRPAAMAQVHEAAIEHGATELVPSRSSNKAQEHAARAADLRAQAEAKRAEADRIAGNVGGPDRAAGRLSAPGLAQAHRNTDSSLRRYVEANNTAAALDHQAGLAEARAAEAARQHFTKDELAGATMVHDGFGWHKVVRVNGKTVTVETPYSWTDTIAHGKIHAVAHPIPGQPGKVRIRKPGQHAA